MKRNVRVMPGAQWLELLVNIRPTATSTSYALGWYSNRNRGARLIRKVHGADPLECPKCRSVKSGPMRVIALIDDPIVVRESLTHLGRWQPEALERAPPVPPEAWPAHERLALTYHPIPDIA